MNEPRRAPLLLGEIDLHVVRQGVEVGPVEIGQRQDRHEHQEAVAVGLELAALRAAGQHPVQHAELGAGEDAADVVLDVASLEQVLGGEDAEQLRIVPVVIPVERDELGECRARTREVQCQRFLAGDEIGIAMLDDVMEQLLLAGEVVIKHAVVALGRLADPVDPRPAIALARELDDRGPQQGVAGLVRRTRPPAGARCALRFGGSFLQHRILFPPFLAHFRRVSRQPGAWWGSELPASWQVRPLFNRFKALTTRGHRDAL